MARIKTFEEACAALKLDPARAVPVVTTIPMHHQDAIVAHAKLVIIAEALNEGWKPNWNDTNEVKYYPWFRVNASAKKTSGSGLSCGAFGRNCSGSGVGSRLCFKSRELAEYAGKKFKKLYEQYFLLS